jgi:hypothetical protein
MQISSKRSVLVWAGLGLAHLLFEAVAEAQGVSFIARLDFGRGTCDASFAQAL